MISKRYSFVFGLTPSPFVADYEDTLNNGCLTPSSSRESHDLILQIQVQFPSVNFLLLFLFLFMKSRNNLDKTNRIRKGNKKEKIMLGIQTQIYRTESCSSSFICVNHTITAQRVFFDPLVVTLQRDLESYLEQRNTNNY